MPNSDPDGYAKGHIGRVYQYILVPACRFAGFSPIRMDDPTMQETPLDIIKTVIESDIVLCDLSSNNPHVIVWICHSPKHGAASNFNQRP
jgi:hypothetical protein